MNFDRKSAAEYASDQRQWLELTGVKVGSRVKVITSAESFQCGWPTVWLPEMSSIKEGRVVTIGRSGIQLESGHCFPFFVLIKYD